MLFDEIAIGGLVLPNRILRSATWEGMATDRGEVTDRMVTLYEDLARGGAGLIVTGFAYVVPAGKALPGQLGIHKNDHILGLRRVAEAVHAHGGRVVVQIVDAGVQSQSSLLGGRLPRGPSSLTAEDGSPLAQAMSTDELEAVIDAFGRAARRVREAGFDGVQLHLAHGYLLNQFLSPGRNRRQDAYGGSPEARRRAVLQAYAAVRAAVEDDFPVLAKLNATDMVPDGLQLEEATACAQALAEAGLDALEISGGIPAAGKLGAVRPGIESPGDEAYFRSECGAIKRTLDIPTYLVGGLRSPAVMREILEAGDADGVALSRPLIREPDLPLRWRAGSRARSACISCRGCLKAGMRGGIHCVDAKRQAEGSS